MAERQRDELSPDDYPSVELIYDFVLPSYDWAVRRVKGGAKVYLVDGSNAG